MRKGRARWAELGAEQAGVGEAGVPECRDLHPYDLQGWEPVEVRSARGC